MEDFIKIILAVIPTYIFVEETFSRLGDYIAKRISFNF